MFVAIDMSTTKILLSYNRGLIENYIRSFPRLWGNVQLGKRQKGNLKPVYIRHFHSS